MNHVILEIAHQLESCAKRLRSIARDTIRDDRQRGMEVANELRSVIAALRLDLLIKYSQKF